MAKIKMKRDETIEFRGKDKTLLEGCVYTMPKTLVNQLPEDSYSKSTEAKPEPVAKPATRKKAAKSKK